MDVAGLRWFQQVADGVSVTELAELEQRSQSGVSRALARLESEVGVPLLRRSGRVLRTTAAGTEFKHHVDRVLHALDDGLAAVSTLAAPDTGTVSLAFPPSLGTWLVPDLIARFRVVHPGVRFDLHPHGDETSDAMLLGGAVDLELTTLRPHADDIRWRPLISEPLLLALPPDHPDPAGESIALSAVSDDPFIATRHTIALRSALEQLCRRAGFEPRVVFEADDLATVAGFVRAGLGVAVLPAPRDRVRDDPVRYRPIADRTAVRQIGIAWSRERRMLPAAERFRRHVIDTAGVASGS
jgi:DNA-binding transcriptional LysR family regulator